MTRTFRLFAIFYKRHGRARHENALFDRAFAEFLQKARSRSSAECAFRPCLCRIFCKRHGCAARLNAFFDRAFVDFLQKARSHPTPECAFRPCLWGFFTKGTVAPDAGMRFSTVPLGIFYKRHGRIRRRNALFDRAFGDFLQKARSHPTPECAF